MVADARHERQQDEHRRDEQGDLRARADRDVHRQVHLVLGGEVDRHPVLGGVADDRHHDQADEELADAELLGGLDDRADEHLGHDADRHAGDGSVMTERLIDQAFSWCSSPSTLRG
jgi:hypothetical protein